MSQAPEQTTNVPAQQPVKEQPNKPTGYRVEEQKTIEINKFHTNRRQRAGVLKVLSIGLFGRRRYRNMYLTSSLNNFYYALMIANALQKRVERLALIISMQKVKYTEYAEEGAQGVDKQYSVFSIKITREPTEEDRKNPGFNEGLDKIENPLTETIKFRTQRRRNEPNKGGRRRNQPRRQGDREGRRQGDREGRREERREVRRQDRREDRRQERREGRTEVRRQDRRQDRREGRTEVRRQDRREIGRFEKRDRRDDRMEVRREERRDDRMEGRREERREERREDRREDRRYERREDRRGYREEGEFDRRPQRFRENKLERVEEDQYRRGERKTRGAERQQAGGRVAEHEYKKEHLNRRNDEREERKDRAPRRNRYSSQEQN